MLRSRSYRRLGQIYYILFLQLFQNIRFVLQRAGCLGSALAIMKKEAKFLPVSINCMVLFALNESVSQPLCFFKLHYP